VQNVWLHKKANLRKYYILAPIIPRYRPKKSLSKLDPHLWSTVNHTILSNNSKYLFVKNSKAACSTVSHAFYQWQYQVAYDGNIHGCRQLLQGSRHTARVVSALTDFEVFKFSFIRNPTKRAVSAYNNFFVDFRNRQHLKHMPFMKKLGFSASNSDDRNFDIFLDYLANCSENDMDRIDPHFRPQFYNVRPDLISYDFLGRVESLDHDIKYIMEKLRERGVSLDLPAVARKNVSKGGYSPTESQVRKLEVLFSKDYDLFE
jgi:hypothetical protein